MATYLLLYRLSGWSQDIIWLVLCGLAIYKMSYWKGHKFYFLTYALSMAFLEIVYAITALIYTNNLFLDYLYIPLEFVLLGLFLKGEIQQKRVDYVVNIASVIFIGFEIYNFFWGQGFENFNSYGAAINNVYLITLSLIAFTMLVKQKANKKLFNNPISWLVLGIFLIYSSIILGDYVYGLAVPYKDDGILYVLLTTQNIVKSMCLLAFIRGIIQIKLPLKN
jgi:hypothetical protein